MEEIYFRDVLHLLWRAKWWMAVVTVMSVAASASLYSTAVPRYEVTMTLVPVDATQNPWEQGQGASSIASQFLGIPLGDRRIQKFQQFMTLFRSPTVLERVDEPLGLLPHLFDSSWDPVRSQWVAPGGWQSQVRTMLRTDLPWVPPNLSDATKYLERTMIVTPVSGGNLVEVRFTDRDPKFGLALLDALYRQSDEALRNRARAQNDEHMAYIQKALSTVSYAETRQSLTSLLTAEVGQRIMINSNSPYAMEILKPPFANPRPVSPSLTRYVLLGIAAGLLLGFVSFALMASLLGGRRYGSPANRRAMGLNKVPVPQEA